MTPIEIMQRLGAQIRQDSGLEPYRPYLGMSQIAKCPLQLYRELADARPRFQSDSDHQNCLRGYMYEARLIQLLTAAGIYRSFGPPNNNSVRELVADWDDRFRGHTDGETVDGELIEFKSMAHEKFEQCVKGNRVLFYHYAQVQCYLHYGGYSAANIVYVSTATFDYHAFRIVPSARTIRDMEDKARRVLAAVDSRVQPVCECGKCGGLPAESTNKAGARRVAQRSGAPGGVSQEVRSA